MATFTWQSFDRLIARLDRIANPDAIPLMLLWETIITEDNRAGVLAGTDKDGEAMKAVTYRPLKSGAKKTTRKQRNLTAANRRGVFAGLGPHPAGANNNLSSFEYRRLGGPPLAPRGAHSRVITNLGVGHDDAANAEGVWLAYGRWLDVLSVKGRYFLPDHFNGTGHNPVRDLRGVRPLGRSRARTAAVDWIKDVIKDNP